MAFIVFLNASKILHWFENQLSKPKIAIQLNKTLSSEKKCIKNFLIDLTPENKIILTFEKILNLIILNIFLWALLSSVFNDQITLWHYVGKISLDISSRDFGLKPV